MKWKTLVILNVFTAALCLGQQKALSGWSWQNPLPQGNTLRAVATPDSNTVIAVGDAGTILRTTDGGVSWTMPNSGVTVDFRAVSFPDASNGTVVGDGGTILNTTDGGITWKAQTNGIQADLSGVSFTDSKTGTVVGGAFVLRTVDGGATWKTQLNRSGGQLYGVSFVDANTGTVVGGSVILGTVDGGTSWNVQTLDSTFPTFLNGVSFSDANNGIAIGYVEEGQCYYSQICYNVVLRTTDGGATWREQFADPPPSDPIFSAVVFTDALTGTVVGAHGGILHTTDGGVTWSSQVSGTSAYLFGVSFSDQNTGTAVGYGGTILRTTDGGATWSQIRHGAAIPLGGVSFANAETLSFVAFTPCRILDTRLPFLSPLRPLQGGWVPANAWCGVQALPPAEAYSLNVTAVPSGPLSYLTLSQAYTRQPDVSTLNSVDGSVANNAAIVPALGGIYIFVTDTTDVILDLNGWFVRDNSR